ncbi:L-rhamnose isomerase [Botrimarina sp.]|uniref:L-rhamnose isomerase n=1 Tax=Botrimarina sp. TaxID=2795802 RepID=UPI0032EA9FE2
MPNTPLDHARQRYAEHGVDVDAAIAAMDQFPVSVHCWQGDDVGGFESAGGELGGGLAVTGNYPGKARTADELRADAEKAYSLIPGKHRFNLHAIYAETGDKKVPRDQLAAEHFAGWIDWAKSQGIGLDFNPTCFGHPLAESGMTLAHADESVRRFWIDHCRACRRIGAAMGQALGAPTVTNVWVPDGTKDTPADRKGPRERLADSLDAVFAEPLDARHNLDAVESKLFGIGAESYTVGSHEFYLGYAAKKSAAGQNVALCLDTGHFHPTETVSDKLSAVLQFVPEVLLHVSRGVRWDSDHVVILSDENRAIAGEIVRGGYAERVHIGLDFFDATINRVAAWVIGVRATQRALLTALLEPTAEIQRAEAEGDLTARLALMEEHKSLPFAAVWEAYCEQEGVPVGRGWLDEVRDYEKNVLSRRN